jgi:hypothetical protein
MSAALYWTGIWFERRLDLQLLPDTYVGVSEFITDQARFAAADEAIAGLSPQLGRWWWLSPIAIVTLLFAGAGHAYTVEGRSFNVVVLTASTCVLAMLVHVLVDNVRFGRGLLRTLGAIDKHRIAAQFTSLAAAPINWRPTFQDVRLVDLEPLSDHLTRSDVLLRSQRHAKLLRAASEVDKLLATISADRTRKESAVVSLDLWAQIKQTCKELTTTLDNTKWSTNFKETSWTGEQLKILADLEFIVLFFISLGLRDLVTRLLAGFSTVMGGLVLLTLAHLLYAFQGRPFWLSIDGIAIAVTTGLAMVILVRLEKDTVLSELWGTTPGKFSLFGGVSFRLVTYVVLTLMTLVAAFFPEVGGGIVKWIRFADPMRSALP